MIEAILFDFDGVIRQWDESDLGTFEAEANIETGTVFATAFSKELHEPLIRGEINWDQWRNETENRLVHSHGEFIRPIVKRFFEFEGRVDADMIDLVTRLPNNLRIGILTNNHDRFEDYLRRVGINEMFDAVINTHRIGVANPIAGLTCMPSTRSRLKLTRVCSLTTLHEMSKEPKPSASPHTISTIKLGCSTF